MAGVAKGAGKIAVVITTQFASGILWPVLRVGAILQSKPVSKRVPAKVLSLTSPLGPFADTTLNLWIAAVIFRTVAPMKYRVIKFWRLMMPIFVKYVGTKYSVRKLSKERRDEIWHKRHQWGGEKVYRLVLELSGFYVKSAQILGSKAEFMPPEWTDKLSILFDQHPPSPYAVMEPAIKEQLRASPFGKALSGDGAGIPDVSLGSDFMADWGDVMSRARKGELELIAAAFGSVDEEALAAASIAQVHTAILRSGSAKKVVIKIQHLGVEELIKTDLVNLKRVAKFLRPYLPFDITPIAEESLKQIPLEFDFERELDMMQRIRSSLDTSKEKYGSIIVPEPMVEFCGPRMLVMEYMEGVPFSRLLKAEPGSEDAALVPLVEDGFIRLLTAYGQMMLIDGVFHADPHAGNLLLRENGDVVLLDFGQTKILPPEVRLFLAQLIDMLADGDEETIVEAMTDAGMKLSSKAGGEADPEVVVKIAYILFDTRYVKEASTNPFDAEGEDSFIKDTGIGFNSQMWMIVRFMLLLRGMFHQFGLDISAVKIWQPYAQKAIDALLEKPEELEGKSVLAETSADSAAVDGVNKPPSAIQMIELRRLAVFLKKAELPYDRKTMKALYMANIVRHQDILSKSEEEFAGIVGWAPNEVSRFYSIVKGASKKSKKGKAPKCRKSLRKRLSDGWHSRALFRRKSSSAK